jgi:N-acetylneuraminate synthase
VNIAGREIGPSHPPFIVAEMASEHRGNYALACELIIQAKRAGADAVKAQIYDPLRLAEARGGKDKLAPPPWDHLTLGELYSKAYTPKEWFPGLFAVAKDIGITLFSSVFDEEAVDYLESLGCPAYKISSFELTDHALICKAASTGKPVILSTGMASNSDVVRAMVRMSRATKSFERTTGAVLHCVSAYPCLISDANLYGVGLLQIMLKPAYPELAYGLSDHTLGTTAAVVATALGASIIEKHITLSRADGGPDKDFSLEPAEFAKLVQDVKDAYASLGTGERPKSEDIYRDLRRKG